MSEPGGAAAPSVHGRALVVLYLVEIAALALALEWYKHHADPVPLTFHQQARIVLSAVVGVGGILYIAWCYVRAPERKPLNFTVVINLVVVVLLLGLGEIAARILSVPAPAGIAVAGTPLLPRSWEQTRARNAALFAHAPAKISYFVSDTLLGWTIAPNRESSDDMYASSGEGVRSPHTGMSYAHVAAPGGTIALIGDSYTFGLEVPFADSWAAQLAQGIGSRYRVLNFGVDGYGLDQSYLRYQRDARPFAPRIVLFGFIQHDLERTLSVYSFITYPEWGLPFAKPRFVMRDGRPTLLNVPLISPHDIASRSAISELPFLEYEPGYHAADWQWHAYDASRLLRFLLSRFPRYETEKPVADDRVEATVTHTLLLQFVREARAAGSIPVVVYFPARSDFTRRDPSQKEGMLRALRTAGVQPIDLTPCIRDVGPEAAFIPGHPHYSAAGNAAVARCLLPTVQSLLHAGRRAA